MNRNDNFEFVAQANLVLFAKLASGATWGYTVRFQESGGGAGSQDYRCISPLQETRRGKIR